MDKVSSNNLRCCQHTLELIAEIDVRLIEIKAIIQGSLEKSELAPFLLPDDLAELVTIETRQNELIVRPKSFLDLITFKALNTIVKEFGGYYVSGGKGSHFVVPKPR